MKINIQVGLVQIEDEKGDFVTMTTDQLLEMMRILNVSINQDGGFIFDVLEFTV
ncbi:hypothetical protein ES702_06687 [subsurface metagenome]